jgi:hypothetical protein
MGEIQYLQEPVHTAGGCLRLCLAARGKALLEEELAPTRSCSLGRQSLRENSGHDRVVKRDH